MNRKILLISLLIFCFIVLVSFFILGSFLVAIIINLINGKNTSRESKEMNEPKISKYFQFNHHNNMTSTGFVYSPSKHLKNEEYLTYYSNTGNTESTTIITNFFEEENENFYECSGSCYCNKEESAINYNNNRRNIFQNNIILSRSLFLIFSSISITIATNLAKQSFENQCIEKYHTSCKPENIIPEVDQCNPISKKNSMSTTSTEEKDKKYIKKYDKTEEGFFIESEDTKKGENHIYECTGYCLRNQRLKKPEALKAADRFGDCRLITLVKIIHYYCILEERKNCNLKARQKFVTKHLSDYCRNNSVVPYFYSFFDKNKRKIRRMRKVLNACVSKEKNQQLYNVRCLRLDC